LDAEAFKKGIYMPTDQRLITFLYLLIRDIMPVGTIIKKIEEIDDIESNWQIDVPNLDSEMLTLAKYFADLIQNN
jgi:hypothetical protein